MLTVNPKKNNFEQQDICSQSQTISINQQSAYKQRTTKQIIYNQKINSSTSRTLNQQKNKQTHNRKKIKLGQQSRSRSRSNSSYCQAGCVRGSSLNKKIGQNNLKKKTQKAFLKSNSGQQKLFSAIQKFYTNLSTMPLDLLITHTNPQQWISEQYQTYRQLKMKLTKLQPQRKDRTHTQVENQSKFKNSTHNKQNLNKKNLAQDFNTNTDDYYKSKLQAVSGILQNIENNMQLLMQLHQQELRSYASNSSLGSSLSNSGVKKIKSQQNSPSINSKIKLIDLANAQSNISINSINNFPSENNIAIQNLKNVTQRNFSISNKNLYKKQQSIYQINDNSSCQSKIQLNDDCKQKSKQGCDCNKQSKIQDIKRNLEQKKDVMWQKFYENLNKLSKNRINKQKCISIDKLLQRQQKQSIDNAQQPHFLSTCRSQQSPTISQQKPSKYGSIQTLQNTRLENQNKQKTIKNTKKLVTQQQKQTKTFIKFDLSSPETQKQIDKKYNQINTNRMKPIDNQNTVKMQSISQFFVKSLLNQNKNNENLRNLFQQIIQGKTKRVEKQPQSLQKNNKYLQNNKNNEWQHNNLQVTLKPLLIQISSLKQQLNQKNSIIQYLLATQQQHEQILQLYKQNEKKHKQSQNYSLQRINTLENTIAKYQKQIKRYQNIDSQLRESINIQIKCLDNLQQNKHKIQQLLQTQRTKHTLQKQQLQSKLQQYQNQIKHMKKQQNISKQKMQIYKQKYYKLLHEQQLRKMIQNNTYNGKALKVKQIRNILYEHRQNLMNLDQQQQLQSNYKSDNNNTTDRRYKHEELTPQSSLQQSAYYTQQSSLHKQSPHLNKIHNKLSNRFLQNRYQISPQSSNLKHKNYKNTTRLNKCREDSEDSDN